MLQPEILPQQQLAQNQHPVQDQQLPPLPALRVGSVGVQNTFKPDPTDSNEERVRKKHLFDLRVALRTRLTEQFVSATEQEWELPQQNALEYNELAKYTVHKTVNGVKHGCDFSIKDEIVNFKLLTAYQHSFNALSKGLKAYLGAYEAWQVQCLNQGDPQYNLTFDLTVYDEAQIGPFITALSLSNKALNSVTIINPRNTNEKRVLKTADEMNEYTEENYASRRLRPGQQQ